MNKEQLNVPFFRKKAKGRPTAARKRSLSPTGSPSTSQLSSSKSEVVLPTKRGTTNLLSAGTKRTTSQRDQLDNDDGASRKEGPDVKWTAAGSHTTAALDIIAGDEIEEILAKRRKKEREDTGLDDQDVPDDGNYHGQAAYKHHVKKTAEPSKAMRAGPQRSTNTIRTVTIIDYQPDVCKDYKETGYCGFGDTCKFLHDRGTYLAGWQLDKLAAENPKKRVEDVSDSDDSDDEDIPFACLICRKHYTDPVVTRCGHYYCSACAIKRYAKTPRCRACGATTGGIFNRADKVIEKLNKKRKEKEEKDGKESGDEGGGGVEIEGLKTIQPNGDDVSEDDNSDSE